MRIFEIHRASKFRLSSWNLCTGTHHPTKWTDRHLLSFVEYKFSMFNQLQVDGWGILSLPEYRRDLQDEAGEKGRSPLTHSQGIYVLWSPVRIGVRRFGWLAHQELHGWDRQDKLGPFYQWEIFEWYYFNKYTYCSVSLGCKLPEGPLHHAYFLYFHYHSWHLARSSIREFVAENQTSH